MATTATVCAARIALRSGIQPNPRTALRAHAVTEFSEPQHARQDASHLRALSRRIYPFRVLGIYLGVLPAALALRELHAGWPSWAWLGACLAWPHLAFALTQLTDAFKAERRNLMVDSAIAGAMVPVIQFNVLPSAALLLVASADKINSGIRGLWWRALPAMVAGLLIAGFCTGFAWQPATSMPVLLATLPLLAIHTLAVSATTYVLMRKVRRQNLRLAEMSRRDALTGLDSRGHWQELAQAALAKHQDARHALTLILIDADKFKDINDRYGHAVGDDVLCAIADAIRRIVPEGSHVGRLGGDEFAAIVPMALKEAEQIAEFLRASVDALRFPRLPNLRCSISLGLAEPPEAGLGLREWSEAADRAMYRAKAAGRNRTASRAE